MPKRIIRSAVLFFCSLVLAQAADQGGNVQIKEEKGKLRIEINGQHFADYVYEGYARPFLYPIIGPGGARMTRNWPMNEAPNEDRDHPHHKSFWWGHGA